ncbi:hypothetical protein NQ186_27685 [Pseudomonas zeae]|uniref:Bacterial Ig-like domain-containing protein n=1 Tax=Pseudomonas zeae TaxID=2745510 RepID=A0ABU5BH44_9PSED|nr:hypothetical protein [Pseudomonas zeae]MDX9675985.1 hypothetical protein [Pseudomonas zeae]UUT12358.1 hypothetical protein NQ186_27685 [Pseudomonas zeae]
MANETVINNILKDVSGNYVISGTSKPNNTVYVTVTGGIPTLGSGTSWANGGYSFQINFPKPGKYEVVAEALINGAPDNTKWSAPYTITV